MEYKVGDVFIVKNEDDFEYYGHGLDYEDFYRSGVKKIKICKIRKEADDGDFETKYKEALRDITKACMDNINNAHNLKSIVDKIIKKQEFDEDSPIYQSLHSYPVYSTEDFEDKIYTVRSLIKEQKDKIHYEVKTNKKSSRRTGIIYGSEFNLLIKSGAIVIDPACLAKQIGNAIKAVSEEEEGSLNER